MKITIEKEGYVYSYEWNVDELEKISASEIFFRVINLLSCVMTKEKLIQAYEDNTPDLIL